MDNGFAACSIMFLQKIVVHICYFNDLYKILVDFMVVGRQRLVAAVRITIRSQINTHQATDYPDGDGMWTSELFAAQRTEV